MTQIKCHGLKSIGQLKKVRQASNHAVNIYDDCRYCSIAKSDIFSVPITRPVDSFNFECHFNMCAI